MPQAGSNLRAVTVSGSFLSNEQRAGAAQCTGPGQARRVKMVINAFSVWI